MSHALSTGIESISSFAPAKDVLKTSTRVCRSPARSRFRPDGLEPVTPAANDVPCQVGQVP